MTSKIITALDLPTIEQAQGLINSLGHLGASYKIGYQLFPIGGYDLARRLVADGKEVFIDAKLLDIGSTVEKGVRSLTEIGAHLLTVHADPDAIKGAVAGRGDSHLKILAVTVLTSWDQDAVTSHGITDSVQDLVLRRAELALEAGADGLIASAQEVSMLRERFGKDPLIVTPGIRPAGADKGDQKRVVTPSAALEQGASQLVIGRPISQAPDPKAAMAAILDEIGGHL